MSAIRRTSPRRSVKASPAPTANLDLTSERRQHTLMLHELKRAMADFKRQTVSRYTHDFETRTRTDTSIPLDSTHLEYYANRYGDDPAATLRQNAIASSRVADLAERRAWLQSLDFSYSHTMSRNPVPSDQLWTGRCWLFGALNVLRYPLIKRYNLSDDFQLSVPYLFFYDKLERAYLWLSQTIAKRHLPLDDWEMIHHLRRHGELSSDGGDWEYAKNLILKYGIIPLSTHGEGLHSVYSQEMNQILVAKVMQLAGLILAATNQSAAELQCTLISDYMPQIYALLVNFMGKPPLPDSPVVWSYHEHSSSREFGEYHRYELSPKDFYKEMVEPVMDLHDYVKLRHDPRHQLYQIYLNSNAAAMVSGEPMKAFTATLAEMKAAIARSIVKEHPVWFASDVTDLHPFGVLAKEAYDYETVLGQSIEVSKLDGLRLRSRHACHVMSVTGFNLNVTGAAQIEELTDEHIANIDRWRVENSWGWVGSDDPGYLLMTNSWFDEHVYEVVVKLDMLPVPLRQRYTEAARQPIMMPDNDVFYS
jgi:bleomycin hydrolase